MADGSRFVYPTGKTPEQLFLTLRTLIDTLNRMRQSESADLTALAATLEDANQQISELWDAVNSSGLTPQQLFELSLVTAVDTMLGSVSNLVKDTIKRSDEAAEAAIKATLAGLQNKGEIRVEQVVRKSENEVFVGQLSSFEATLNNTQAAVNNEIIARTNGDEALAESVGTLTTTVNGNTSQINILALSIDGIEGRFGVAVNLNGQVVGLVQLDGTPSGSAFTVVADKLMVAYPGINGGDPIPVLTVEEIDEESVLAFNGTILANAVATGALSTLELTAVFAHLGSGYVDGILQSDPENENGNLKLDFDNIDFELTTADLET